MAPLRPFVRIAETGLKFEKLRTIAKKAELLESSIFPRHRRSSGFFEYLEIGNLCHKCLNC